MSHAKAVACFADLVDELRLAVGLAVHGVLLLVPVAGNRDRLERTRRLVLVAERAIVHVQGLVVENDEKDGVSSLQSAPIPGVDEVREDKAVLALRVAHFIEELVRRPVTAGRQGPSEHHRRDVFVGSGLLDADLFLIVRVVAYIGGVGRIDVNVSGWVGTHGCRFDLRVVLLLVIQGHKVQLVESRLGRRGRGRQRRKRIAVLDMC